MGTQSNWGINRYILTACQQLHRTLNSMKPFHPHVTTYKITTLLPNSLIPTPHSLLISLHLSLLTCYYTYNLSHLPISLPPSLKLSPLSPVT